jgi:hypothetical protein
MATEDSFKALKDLQCGDDAIDQSMALNRITMQLLHDRAKDCKRLWIALVVSILVNFVTVAGFLWYESQWEYTTTETTITQDTEDGPGNNVYQAGENATYYESSSAEEGE